MTAERQIFPARTEAFPEVRAFVEARCASLRADRETTLRLLLVAEELFINTVVHGYAGAPGERVMLTVRDAGREIELVLEDTAGAFDPFADIAAPTGSSDGPPGGLGRVLVAGMAASHGYQRRGERNRVTVGVRKSGPARKKPRKK